MSKIPSLIEEIEKDISDTLIAHGIFPSLSNINFALNEILNGQDLSKNWDIVLNDAVNKIFAMPENNVVVPILHMHEWTMYNGFTESYEYCKSCGNKK